MKNGRFADTNSERHALAEQFYYYKEKLYQARSEGHEYDIAKYGGLVNMTEAEYFRKFRSRLA